MPEQKVEVEEEVDAELEAKVQAGLDAVNSADSDGDTDNQQTEDNDSTPENQADDDNSTSDDEPKDTDETGDTEDSKNEGTEEVQLPDAYYRAAIHQGWKPDEIKEFFEANPELALKTLEANHRSTNKLNAEFSRIGRIKPADTLADSMTATEAIADKGVDIAALKEQYGDDSAVVKAFEVMQTKLAAQPDPVREEPAVLIPQDDPMRSTVDRFFTDPAMKPYEDFYGSGKDTNKLTQEQYKHRYDMLQMAENVAIGSNAHGRQITAEQAMEAAHLLVSEPVREKALRVELKAKVTKRAKGVILKPTKSKAAKSKTDGKLTEKQREAKVEAGLRKIFGK